MNSSLPSGPLSRRPPLSFDRWAQGGTLKLASLTCLCCSYPLKGLRYEGQCPECGMLVRDTLGVFVRHGALASGVDRLRYCYISSFALLLAAAPWVAASVSLTVALFSLIAALTLLFGAKLQRVPPMRARLCALVLISLLQGSFPPILVILDFEGLAVAYVAIVTVLVSVLLASGVTIRIARPIGCERIVDQLGSARLLVYAALGSLVVFAAPIVGLSLRGAAIMHIVIMGVLGIVALAHTVVALAGLAKAIRLEGASQAE